MLIRLKGHTRLKKDTGLTSTIYCVSPNTCGTYLGLIEKIPYLKSLGITAVELMPVHQFDPEEGNYWGYMPLNFFSPHDAYASVAGNEIVEFKTMVKGLHEAGIEVIIDVVYNHTTEADANGPNYAFPGIDNSTYYLWAEDRSEYRNDAGLFRCAHDCRGLGPGKLSTRQNVSGDDTAAMETDSATTCGPSSEEILDWWKLS